MTHLKLVAVGKKNNEPALITELWTHDHKLWQTPARQSLLPVHRALRSSINVRQTHGPLSQFLTVSLAIHVKLTFSIVSLAVVYKTIRLSDFVVAYLMWMYDEDDLNLMRSSWRNPEQKFSYWLKLSVVNWAICQRCLQESILYNK